MVMCLQNLNPCNLATQPTSDVMLVTFPSLACGKNIVGIGIEILQRFYQNLHHLWICLFGGSFKKNCIVTKPQ